MRLGIILERVQSLGRNGYTKRRADVDIKSVPSGPDLGSRTDGQLGNQTNYR